MAPGRAFACIVDNPIMATSLQLFDDPALPPQVAQDMLRRARPAEPGHFDELRDAEGKLRASWQAFAEHLDAPGRRHHLQRL